MSFFCITVEFVIHLHDSNYQQNNRISLVVVTKESLTLSSSLLIWPNILDHCCCEEIEAVRITEWSFWHCTFREICRRDFLLSAMKGMLYIQVDWQTNGFSLVNKQLMGHLTFGCWTLPVLLSSRPVEGFSSVLQAFLGDSVVVKLSGWVSHATVWT